METAKSPIDAKITGLVDAAIENRDAVSSLRNSLADMKEDLNANYNATMNLLITQENDRNDINALYDDVNTLSDDVIELCRDLAACKIVLGCTSLVALCGVVLAVM